MKTIDMMLHERDADMSFTLDPELWRWQFPPFKGEIDMNEQLNHIIDEVYEAAERYEAGDELGFMMELMDVIHAAETAMRQIDLPMGHFSATKRSVVRKNLNRGYYGHIVGD